MRGVQNGRVIRETSTGGEAPPVLGRGEKLGLLHSMARLGDADRRNLTPGGSAFLPVRKEKVRPARRAVVRDQDICGVNARARELILGDGNEIKARGGNMLGGVPRRVGVQKGNRMSIGGRFGGIRQGPEKPAGARKTSAESFHNLLAHFITAGTNGGPQRRNQCLWIGAESAPHVAHGFLHDPR